MKKKTILTHRQRMAVTPAMLEKLSRANPKLAAAAIRRARPRTYPDLESAIRGIVRESHQEDQD